MTSPIIHRAHLRQKNPGDHQWNDSSEGQMKFARFVEKQIYYSTVYSVSPTEGLGHGFAVEIGSEV